MKLTRETKLFLAAGVGLLLFGPMVIHRLDKPEPATANVNAADALKECEYAVTLHFPSEKYSGLVNAEEHQNPPYGNSFRITYQFKAVNSFGNTVTYQTICTATHKNGKFISVDGGNPVPVVD